MTETLRSEQQKEFAQFCIETIDDVLGDWKELRQQTIAQLSAPIENSVFYSDQERCRANYQLRQAMVGTVEHCVMLLKIMAQFTHNIHHCIRAGTLLPALSSARSLLEASWIVARYLDSAVPQDKRMARFGAAYVGTLHGQIAQGRKMYTEADVIANLDELGSDLARQFSESEFAIVSGGNTKNDWSKKLLSVSYNEYLESLKPNYTDWESLYSPDLKGMYAFLSGAVHSQQWFLRTDIGESSALPIIMIALLHASKVYTTTMSSYFGFDATLLLERIESQLTRLWEMNPKASG